MALDGSLFLQIPVRMQDASDFCAHARCFRFLRACKRRQIPARMRDASDSRAHARCVRFPRIILFLYISSKQMTCPGFITALLAMSSPSSSAQTSQPTQPPAQPSTPLQYRPRPGMLPCDKDGKCPVGSQCLKLFANYGVCVLENVYDHPPRPGP
ncbi:unnamed protein product [Ectocarpus sp. 12 AP-2014]